MPLPSFRWRAKCVKPYLSPFGFSLHCRAPAQLSDTAPQAPAGGQGDLRPGCQATPAFQCGQAGTDIRMLALGAQAPCAPTLAAASDPLLTKLTRPRERVSAGLLLAHTPMEGAK
jgi:hypothetical protein